MRHTGIYTKQVPVGILFITLTLNITEQRGGTVQTEHAPIYPCNRVNIAHLIVSDQSKVITDNVCPQNGHIYNGLLTLIAVHYAYSLAYNPIVREVMDFLS